MCQTYYTSPRTYSPILFLIRPSNWLTPSRWRPLYFLLRPANEIGRKNRRFKWPLAYAKKKPRFNAPGLGERPNCVSFGQGLEPSPRGLPPTHRAELETAKALFKQHAPNG